MKVFYDTEFLEDGNTIRLISIGMVAEDGTEYYAISSDMPVEKIADHHWLMTNVVSQLPLAGAGITRHSSGNLGFSLDMNDVRVKPHWVIANEVRTFLLGFDDLELWAYYGAYDHVALAQLWGPMYQLPAGIPMWTNDLMQLEELVGRTPPEQSLIGEHNALEDARHNQRRWQYLNAAWMAAKTQRTGVFSAS